MYVLFSLGAAVVFAPVKQANIATSIVEAQAKRKSFLMLLCFTKRNNT